MTTNPSSQESHIAAEMVLTEQIEGRILFLRGQKVMLDRDLAALYGVPTKALKQAVKRNADRFPVDFMFEMNEEETAGLRSQIVTSKRGGTRYAPMAFTEQGVAMLSSVLSSSRAIQVNIAIMRTFARLRQMLASHADLAIKLESLERKYDKHFRVVFDALRQLMADPKPNTKQIGFGVKERGTTYRVRKPVRHFIWPEMFEWLETRVTFPKGTRQHIEGMRSPP